MGKIKSAFLEVESTGNLTIDAASVLELNAAGGAINIGNDVISQPINIGTGAAARTITVGNVTGATAVNIDIGTGDFTMTSATGNLVTQLDTGEMTKPLQPAFLAALLSDDDNVTGNGAAYTIGTNVAFTEIFDQGGHFATSPAVFTAPVTGRYYFTTLLFFGDITSAMNSSIINLNTSNRSYIKSMDFQAVAPGTIGSIDLNVFADMDASDTASVIITIFNGAGDDADLNATRTFFAGYLVC